MSNCKTCQVSIFLLKLFVGSIVVLGSGCIRQVPLWDLQQGIKISRYIRTPVKKQKAIVNKLPEDNFVTIDWANTKDVTLAKGQKVEWRADRDNIISVNLADNQSIQGHIIQGPIINKEHTNLVVALTNDFVCTARDFPIPVRGYFTLQADQKVMLTSSKALTTLSKKTEFKADPEYISEIRTAGLVSLEFKQGEEIMLDSSQVKSNRFVLAIHLI